MDKRKKIYIAIAVVCVVTIISAIFMQLDLKIWGKKKPNENVQAEEKTQEELKRNFDNLFNNEITLNNYDTSKIKKYVDGKEIVYTTYENNSSEDNKYEINVHIPVININNDVGAKFNNITQKIFADKTTAILESSTLYTIYTIDYTGYVNGDILSVIIRSTLKEGSTIQRTIVETYNYNLATGEEVDIYDVISLKNITTNEINSKVNTEITKAIKEANKIQLAGFSTYTRDINSDMYQIDNITTFFIGPDEKLYLVFAYGNNNFTSEMDIIEF